MKYAWKNLCTFARTECLLFILTLLCVASSAIVLHFAYGLYQNYHQIRIGLLNNTRELVIDIRDPMQVTKKKLEECLLSLSDDVNNNVNMYLVLPLFLPEPTQDDVWSPFEIRFAVQDHKITRCELFRKNMEDHLLTDGRYFTVEEDEEGALVALVDEEYDYYVEAFTVQNDADGYYIQLGGKMYEVVGVERFSVKPIVPFNSLDDDTLFETRIYISMEKYLTRSQYEEIRSAMIAFFHDAVAVPELTILEAEDLQFYNTILMIAIAISGIAATNFAILYRYMLERRNKTIFIFRICGCKRHQAIRIFMTECLFIMLPVYLLSACMYAKLMLPKLEVIFPYMEGAYTTAVYTLIFIIYFLTSLLMLFIMIARQIHGKSLLDTKRRQII